jgi:hypothetical protein
VRSFFADSFTAAAFRACALLAAAFSAVTAFAAARFFRSLAAGTRRRPDGLAV